MQKKESNINLEMEKQFIKTKKEHKKKQKKLWRKNNRFQKITPMVKNKNKKPK